MTNKEIREHISTAQAHIDRAMDELAKINAHATWQDLFRIKRRLAELTDLFMLEEQEGEE